ncbi:MAG: ABC transporter substrate-binding protein [Thermoplasmata archaeon]
MERNAWIIIAALAAVSIILAGLLAASLVGLIGGVPEKIPKRLSLNLWWPIAHYGDTEPDIAAILESSLEATGRIDVTLQSAEWATYVDQFSNSQMGMFLLGWYPDFFDADNYIQPFLSTGGAASLGSDYSDPLMDLAILNSRTSFGDQRNAVFAEIQQKLAEDAIYIPLFQGNQHVVYQDDVTGVVLEPVRSFRYDQIQKPGEATLRVGTTDRVVTLDTADAYDYFSVELSDHIFEKLLDYEPGTANLIPSLAMEVPSTANGLISADGMTYTFNIRPGVTFHDATALDAAAVAFSLNRARTLGGDPGFLLDIISDVQATGPMEVTVTLNNPFTAFNALMAFSVAAIVSPTAYPSDDFRSGLDANVPIGTGPYMLESGNYQADQRATLTRNPNYWGTPAKHATVQVNLISDATALKTQIETGQIHVAFRTLNPADLLDLQTRASSLGLTVEIGTSPFIRYIVFNVLTPPFDNVWVRRAIAAAVDRGEIVAQVFEDLAFPLYSMIADIFDESTAAFLAEYGPTPDIAQANGYLDNYFDSLEEALGQPGLFSDLILPTREAS